MTTAEMPGWLSALADRVDEIPDVFPRLAPPPSGGRRSAVLILFGPTGIRPAAGSSAGSRDGSSDGAAVHVLEATDVLLTQRAADLRSHPGQVAFPGGGVDPSDESPVAAALREAWEETGLDRSGVEVLGSMTDLFLPPSGYLVTPVLAWWARPSEVAPVDRREVERVVRVPLAELLDPANRFSVRHRSGYTGPGFTAGGLFVWGFTAGLLALVLAEAGLEKPWDETRFEPLPDMDAPDVVTPERGLA